MTNDKGILIRNIFYMLTYAFKSCVGIITKRLPGRISTTYMICLLKSLPVESLIN